MDIIHLEPYWFTLVQRDDTKDLWHPELEIVFILQGTGRVLFSDLKTSYSLRSGDIFAVNSFEVRDFELEEGAAALSFSASSGFVGDVAPELLKHRVNCRSFLHTKENQATFDILRRDLAKAFQVHYKNEETGGSYIKSSAAVILEDLNQFFLDEKLPVETGGVQDTLRKITGYLHNHYRERVTLDELARYTYLSKTYISRCFTKYLGISFTAYLELLRLSAAIRLLAEQKTLSQVSEESGFSNINAMIQAFRHYRGVTPGEYRRAMNSPREMSPKEGVHEEGNDLFAALLRYAAVLPQKSAVKERVLELTVDTAGKKQPLSAHWKRMLNVGYARSLTDGRIQRELRRLEEKIGFEYLRIKGILDDDMCLLRLDMNGNPVMNFSYVDEGIDFILSLGAKPMLELSFMPGLLARNTSIRSMRGGVLSAPKELDRWKDLIMRLIEHLKQRYGEDNASVWLYSPWLAPDFIGLGLCGREEYAQVYSASFHAIREVLPRALIVGPGTSFFAEYWPWYRDMCRSLDCMPDILSFRSFAAVGERDSDEMKLIGNNESFPFAVSGDENYLANTASEIREILKQDGLGHLPLIVEEWSNNIWQRDLCNDTCYKSAYLFKNILENNQNLSAMGYFALNDRLDEVPPSGESFHGGFGLFTQDDIPKSACLAMELLAQMGDKLLGQGDGYLISQRGEEIQIFLYNYSHYDLLYRYRHVANMDLTTRDRVFVSRESRGFFIRLRNLPEADYRIRRYSITPSGGSSYDDWVHMGAPSPMSREERERLQRLACPQYHTQRMGTVKGELHIKASLAAQDVCLIRINRSL